MRKASSRSKPRIDYKIYDQTGKKILKESAKLLELSNKLEKELAMSENQLSDQETKLRLEISGFWGEYDLDDLYGIDQISDSISELKNIKRRFENVHVDLRRNLEEEWAPKYPGYDDLVERMASWIKTARNKISERKREESLVPLEMQAKSAEQNMYENARVEQTLLRTDEKHLVIKLDQLLNTVDFENVDEIDEVETDLFKLGGLIEKYLEMHHKLELSLGNTYEEEFGDEFKKKMSHMNELIIIGRNKVKSIKRSLKLNK